MDFHSALERLVNRRDLSADAMRAVMRTMMSGALTDAQIGGFLAALRTKGETIEEIAAAAAVMREFATQVPAESAQLVDIVGTGGDGAHTFNISTAAAFVIAAAGGKVAKHNNRAISSRSGSADVLEQAGVKLGLKPEQVARCIDQAGISFMFAPAHHPATRHAAGPRKELGVRSLFNLLGPLTNPAGVKNHLIGVAQPELLEIFAQVLRRLGSRHAIIARAEDGMDEISNSTATAVAELKDGRIETRKIVPQEFGFDPAPRDAIRVSGPEESLALMLSVFDNQPGPALDIVLLNAGAGIYVAGLRPDMAAGVALARETVAAGKAREKLQALAALTQQLAEAG